MIGSTCHSGTVVVSVVVLHGGASQLNAHLAAQQENATQVHLDDTVEIERIDLLGGDIGLARDS